MQRKSNQLIKLPGDGGISNDLVFSLKKIPSNVELAGLLGELIKDEKSIIDIANNSYRHQLGFEKYVLRIFSSGATLRLHHWDRLMVSEEDIHSHCAKFFSRLCLGEMKQQAYELISGASHACFGYQFNSRTGKSEARAVGDTCVVPGTIRSLRAGDSYILQAAELHRVTSVAVGTVTISYWEPRLQEAVVLKHAGEHAKPCCARAGMEVLSVRQQLQKIKYRLEENDS